MRNKWIIAIFSFSVLLLPSFGKAEEEIYNLGQVVVTAGRIPLEASRLTRSVTIIDSTDIKNAPAHSLPELLGYVAGVDVKRRGVEGIQADMSIRGSTFEQVLILVDGTKVSDPQTGHHNMDIPLTLADIERIEILQGPGSAIYGPNAFGGVINIITKRVEEAKTRASFILGENSLSAASISASFPRKNSTHIFSLERKESSGYQYNTEFDILTLHYRSTLKTPFAPFDFSVGYTDKEFGADSFYSNLFPNEWEKTETTLANLGARFENNTVSLEPALYWRHHRDKFVLDRTDPAGFISRHTTDVYGGELDLRIPFSQGEIVLGGELGEEKIDSANLGERSRVRGAIFAEFQPKLENNFLLDMGVRADHYEEWDWEVTPGIGLGYRINRGLKLRASFGRAFRVPTYTELYYDSPANKGNPGLAPEKAKVYEVGIDWTGRGFSWETTLFRREGHNLIDWVRPDSNKPWEVRNVSEIDTNGLEILFKMDAKKFYELNPFSIVSLGYTYLDSDRGENNLQSKYALNYLAHQVCLGLEHFMPFNIYQTWKLQFKDRVNGDTYFLLDTRLSRKFRKRNAEVFVEGTNLFNTSYEEIEGVSMPGRWISAGIKLTF